MKNQIKKHNPRILKAFQTFPLASNEQKDPITNATIPSQEDVVQAKEWVDDNKK